MKQVIHHITPLIFLVVTACIEPYDFESLGSERTLVIDGSLTNEFRRHNVSLSYSFPIDTIVEDRVPRATVFILDDRDNQYPFVELYNGYYESIFEFAAEAGVGYQLIVSLNGKEYISEFERLAPPARIDSIYGRYLTLPSSETGSFDRGIQFFIDAYDDTGDAGRYRYEWEETYEIRVPYRSYFEWDEEIAFPVPREERIDICYQSNRGSSLILTSTRGLSEPRVSELPIQFVQEDGLEMRSRYSLLVRQYSLNAGAYQYYKQLKDNNEGAGSFFDSQKGTIPGNFRNVDDPDETILGYFEVASVTETRRYFEPIDFAADGFRTPPYPNCNPTNSADTLQIFEMSEYFTSEGSFWYIINELFPPGSGYLILPYTCADCRVHGELGRPEFWED